jgi:hypothetical protein
MLELLKPITVKEAANNWRNQYFVRNGNKWGSTISGPANETYDRILKARTYRHVNEIIGNQGWTNHYCDGCGNYIRNAVRFSAEYSDQSHTFCADCIKAASRLLRKEGK